MFTISPFVGKCTPSPDLMVATTTSGKVRPGMLNFDCSIDNCVIVGQIVMIREHRNMNFRINPFFFQRLFRSVRRLSESNSSRNDNTALHHNTQQQLELLSRYPVSMKSIHKKAIAPTSLSALCVRYPKILLSLFTVMQKL